MTRDEFADMAWAAFVTWAFKTPEMIAAFEADTGARYFPPKNGLEAMIDKATGHLDEYVKKFTYWVTVNHWGYDDAPEKFKQEHPKRAD